MQLRTLGAFELVTEGADGQLAPVLSGQKPLALLTYLALQPGRRATRDRLIDLLWRNIDPERARRTLRQTIWSIRHTLGETALQTDGEALVLALALDLDVDRFDRAADAGDAAAAWTVYGGPFVPELAASGTAGFEQWCDLQRDRLQARWSRVGRALFEAHLAAEEVREAAVVARRLREAAPDDLDGWTRELRAWLAAGDRREALVCAQAFDDARRELGLPAPDEVMLPLLGQIHRPRDGRIEATESRARPRPELVGRERTLAVLLERWRHVQQRKGGVLSVLRGSAGIGKTRLVEEFLQRLGPPRSHRLLLRARPVDRDMPYALAAAIAEALAELPGALGISDGSAAVLVDLAPSLSSTYRVATPRVVAADDMLRMRTLALVELVVATAEEAPLALLIDDLHWADEPSRQLLSGLADRLTRYPVLLLVVTRRHGRPWVIPDGAGFVDLAPLGAEQLSALITSMAACDPRLLHELTALLHDTTGGVPMLALAALDLGLEHRLLRIEGEQWQSDGIDALRRLIGHGGVLEKLLADLPPSGVAMLCALALCGGPLEEEVLRASAGEQSADEALRELIARGLLAQSATGWEIAHDRLADAVLAIVAPVDRRMIGQRCGQALLGVHPREPRWLQLAGRLLAGAGHEAMHEAFTRWLQQLRDPERWRHAGRSASEFLGEQATSTQVQQLASGVPWPRRLRHGYPGSLRAAAALLLLTASASAGLAGSSWLEPRAVGMVLTTPSTNKGFLFDSALVGSGGGLGKGIPLPLAIDFLDRDGRRTRRTPREVTVRAQLIRGRVQLSGAVTRRVTLGHVSFDDLVVRGSGVFTLEVAAAGLPSVHSEHLIAVSPQMVDGLEHVEVVGGELNGQQLDPLRKTVTAARGALLRGSLRIRATTASPSAAMLLGAIPIWGDRRTNYMVLSALPPFGETEMDLPFADAADTTHRLRAPEQPGRYPLLLVVRSETEMRFIASGTNWKLQTPRWFDGDDLADLPGAALDSLAQSGFTHWTRLVPRSPGTTSPIRMNEALAGTVITLIVRP